MDINKVIKNASDPEAVESQDVDLLGKSETEPKKNIEVQVQTIKE